MSHDGLRIRVGHEADLTSMLAIARSSEGAPQWSEAVWRGLLQTAAGSYPVRQVFVAVDTEQVVGFLVVMLSGDVAEIESVAVQMELRRKGVGGALCRHSMHWARERGASQIELEVRSQSTGARALYASLGFVQQGVRARYYQHPGDDAVLLSASL
jgi:ribosomal-protein-alanine N-acetyltransferase